MSKQPAVSVPGGRQPTPEEAYRLHEAIAARNAKKMRSIMCEELPEVSWICVTARFSDESAQDWLDGVLDDDPVLNTF